SPLPSLGLRSTVTSTQLVGPIGVSHRGAIDSYSRLPNGIGPVCRAACPRLCALRACPTAEFSRGLFF
ncbi:hypothetical protein TGAM01_v208331, partial [Trichoderma gamsii]